MRRNAYYYVIARLEPVDAFKYRYRFDKSQWDVAGDADIHLPGRWVMKRQLGTKCDLSHTAH